LISEGTDPRVGKVYTVKFPSGHTARLTDSEIQFMVAERMVVYLDEEDPADMREIVGAVIEFTVGGERRGVSRWTIEDTQRAHLDRNRGTKESNHVLYPRNLYLARSMSNGVKWLLPECIAGLPIYSLGEIPRGEDLGKGEGGTSEPGWGDVAVSAVHEVERLIRRAEKVSHAGLADRGVWQMKLRGQPDPVVGRIIQDAASELAKIESAQISTAEEVPGGAEEPPQEQGSSGGVSESAAAAPAHQTPDAEPQEPERGETSPAGSAPVPPVDVQALRDQLETARGIGDADAVAEIEAQLDALTPEDDSQLPLA
jgi:hypothetical protein